MFRSTSAAPRRLGFSLNPIQWVESGVDFLENTFEPGTNLVAPLDSPVNIVQLWASAERAKATSTMTVTITRMPPQYGNGGELCAFFDPGSAAAYLISAGNYELAPANVRDIDHAALPGSDVYNYIVGLVGTAWGQAASAGLGGILNTLTGLPWTTIGLVAGGALVAFFVLPEVVGAFATKKAVDR